jgi:hypothetical protein
MRTASREPSRADPFLIEEERTEEIDEKAVGRDVSPSPPRRHMCCTQYCTFLRLV